LYQRHPFPLPRPTSIPVISFMASMMHITAPKP
jgi:hypothetical protein